MHSEFILESTYSFGCKQALYFKYLSKACIGMSTSIDMQRQTPCQQLIPKDLHGNEWHFQHVNQRCKHQLEHPVAESRKKERTILIIFLEAWNAQNGGALAILVLDDKSEQMITMDTPE
ncbi:uncharacterized protein LOC110646163 isoform X2 [Hevea brasiliensis]|uniref:uncharacterized protein LOC110646163 isoform X2 n=1 Tax=Hevea brasiliensis TaxID=3981 RepID=UPI0025E00CB7|nr:uncharacterized protein LOC110646163 isoform X2 [Hevea brasiliensis]